MTKREHQQVLEWACKQGRFLGGHDLYGPMLVTKSPKQPEPMNNVHINGEGFEGVKRDALLSAIREVGPSQALIARKLKISRHTVYAWMEKFMVIAFVCAVTGCISIKRSIHPVPMEAFVPPRMIGVLWDYGEMEIGLYFEVWSSTNLVDWILATNTVQKSVAFPMKQMEFFKVRASDTNGEKSDWATTGR